MIYTYRKHQKNSVLAGVKNVQSDKWGLVLAGGGGNGAFEMGVWQALRETDKYDIAAVSGSSVGALNAAFFAADSYDTALALWQSIDDADIKIPLNAAKKQDGESRGGIWSSEGVEKILRRPGFAESVKNAAIPCAVCCTLAPETAKQRARALMTYTDSMRYFTLNGQECERIIRILLASAAISHGFPEQKIDGRFYRDGDNVGRGDCMPVQPLYDMGYRNFIVVHLDNYKKLRLSREAREDASVRYIHIRPPHDLDNPLTILDFGHESNLSRIKMGYEAGKRALAGDL